MTVGEVPMTRDMEALAAYVLPANHELNMVFHFQLMEIDALRRLEPRQWSVKELRDVISRWQMFRREDGFWNTYVHCLSFSQKLFKFVLGYSSKIMTRDARCLVLGTIARSGVQRRRNCSPCFRLRSLGPYTSTKVKKLEWQMCRSLGESRSIKMLRA